MNWFKRLFYSDATYWKEKYDECQEELWRLRKDNLELEKLTHELSESLRKGVLEKIEVIKDKIDVIDELNEKSEKRNQKLKKDITYLKSKIENAQNQLK